VQTKERPSEVKLWHAINPKARDFRLMTIGATWKSKPLDSEQEGLYLGNVEAPPDGWAAFFVELTFANESRPSLKFTTGVRVTPERLPFSYPPKAND
jgi:PhoPQ-activated pathogenicity-related protein